VRCCCAMLAQMNQTMVNMNINMSLTAIDKRLMMKQAANCACASHAVPMARLDGDVLMWWRDFGDFHQSGFKTRFWQFSWSDPTKPNQSGLGLIGIVFRNFGLFNFAWTFPELTENLVISSPELTYRTNRDSRSSLPDPTCWPSRKQYAVDLT
jgi:hypothetical protein